MENVFIPPTVERIGWMTFDHCLSFTSIDIPEGVKILDTCCFNECENVVTISIPSTITTMGESVFHCCERSSLEKIKSYIQEPFRIDGFSFFEYSLIAATLYVPKGTKEKYENTYVWNCFRNIKEMDSDESGDINRDGVVDTADVNGVVNSIMSRSTEAIDTNLDVNSDGVVNVADIVDIVKILIRDKGSNEISTSD